MSDNKDTRTAFEIAIGVPAPEPSPPSGPAPRADDWAGVIITSLGIDPGPKKD